ncbi:MAG TPA: cyclodeaminase/cyclohydrolase family protein [Bacillota bacterium]|nr:cyclodeaminase/cyclohydrolase family protein [Bacillota bacterium]
MYIEMTVQEFLDKLASASPAPGGGSVSALAGSIAASLAAMVARFTAGGSGGEDEVVQGNLAEAIRLQNLLQQDVEADTAAYNRVVAAYRLPRESAAQKEERSCAIQEALQEATRLPLQVAQRSLEVLRLCRWAVAEGNPNTWSDAYVAALMAQSGIEGALANVAINLGQIKEAAFKEEMKAQAAQIRREAKLLQEEISAQLRDRLV